MAARLPASELDCGAGSTKWCSRNTETQFPSRLKQENPESPQIIKLEEDLLQITVGVKAEENSLLQEIPQSPQTKEEPEEVRIKHEEEPLPLCLKTEESSPGEEEISQESEGDTEHSSNHNDEDEDFHLQPVSSETDDDGDDHHRFAYSPASMTLHYTEGPCDRSSAAAQTAAPTEAPTALRLKVQFAYSPASMTLHYTEGPCDRSSAAAQTAAPTEAPTALRLKVQSQSIHQQHQHQRRKKHTARISDLHSPRPGQRCVPFASGRLSVLILRVYSAMESGR
uniref:Uncharacterized protein n=1 Tax=Knipowitschia caucasica TaxID=637954 RepID=A0AAV2MDV0_KNICA